jgi:putative nucleotidyltransferase with HDIG domain
MEEMAIQIANLVDELSLLPEQGTATMRLLRLLDDPDADARDIVPIIEADPSMTARLLTLANSAFFGLKQHASNVWSAVMVVGFNVVRALATTGGLGLNDDRPGAMPSNYWNHAIATGAGASRTARRVGERSSDAFSAGLLHDVGAALLWRSVGRPYQALAVEIDGNQRITLEAERAQVGAGHDEIGAAVLDSLFFPRTLVDAVAGHNHALDAVEGPMGLAVICGMALAEAAGVPGATEAPVPLPDALDAIGIPTTQADELLAETSREIDELRALLS